MESALGAPIETHQDAINAAYLSVGWTWGADTPDELDDAAYRKAWSWGFRIDEFAETRGERFASAHLSSRPLRAGAVSMGARAQVSDARSVAAPAVVESVRTNERSDVDHERIASVERRVAAAQREISRIGEQISALEQRSAGGTRVSRDERKAQLDALNRSLEDSHETLGALQRELRAVVSAVQRQ